MGDADGSGPGPMRRCFRSRTVLKRTPPAARRTGSSTTIAREPTCRRSSTRTPASSTWGGGRTAALVHTTADGTADLNPPANVRADLLRGRPARSGRVSARGRRGTAEGQPHRLLVEHAGAVRRHGRMGEGGRGRRRPAAFRACRTTRWSRPPTWRSPRSPASRRRRR